MKNMDEYLKSLKSDIDNAEEISEVVKISDDAFMVSGHFKTMIEVFSMKSPEGFSEAIASDFEVYQKKFSELSDHADEVIKEMEQQEADDEKYGTYGDQVRSTYYASVL